MFKDDRVLIPTNHLAVSAVPILPGAVAPVGGEQARRFAGEVILRVVWGAPGGWGPRTGSVGPRPLPFLSRGGGVKTKLGAVG